MAFNEPCFVSVRFQQEHHDEDTMRRYNPYPYYGIINKIGYRIKNIEDFNNIEVFDIKTNEPLHLLKRENDTLYFEADDGRTVDVLASGYIVLTYNERIKIAVRDIHLIQTPDRLGDVEFRVVNKDNPSRVSTCSFDTHQFFYNDTVFDINMHFSEEEKKGTGYHLSQYKQSASIQRTTPGKILSNVEKLGTVYYCNFEESWEYFSKIIDEELKKDPALEEIRDLLTYSLSIYFRNMMTHYAFRFKDKLEDELAKVIKNKEEVTAKYVDDLGEVSEEVRELENEGDHEKEIERLGLRKERITERYVDDSAVFDRKINNLEELINPDEVEERRKII